MVSTRLLRGAVGLLCVAVLAGARTAWSHPLHTTLTEIALDSADGSMRLTIRAFADDFSAVVARHAGKPRPADYNVSGRGHCVVHLGNGVGEENGRKAPLTWGGVRRTGDLMWVTVRVPSVRSLRGVKIADDAAI